MAGSKSFIALALVAVYLSGPGHVSAAGNRRLLAPLFPEYPGTNPAAGGLPGNNPAAGGFPGNNPAEGGFPGFAVFPGFAGLPGFPGLPGLPGFPGFGSAPNTAGFPAYPVGFYPPQIPANP